MCQVLPFDWLTTDQLVSGIYIASGYGLRITGYTFLSLIKTFSAYCNPVLCGSILLLPCRLTIFAWMARITGSQVYRSLSVIEMKTEEAFEVIKRVIKNIKFILVTNEIKQAQSSHCGSSRLYMFVKLNNFFKRYNVHCTYNAMHDVRS